MVKKVDKKKKKKKKKKICVMKKVDPQKQN